MEVIKFLNQSDFKEVLEQTYVADNEYANAMVLLNYLNSFKNGTILKIDVNDNRFTRKFINFFEDYVRKNISFLADKNNIVNFNTIYGMPIFIRFITSTTNIDLSKALMENKICGIELSNNLAYEYFVINEIYKRQGVDKSITSMSIINFGLNEIIAVSRRFVFNPDFSDQMKYTLTRTLLAIMYYIKYNKESDSILDYFAKTITENNFQELFKSVYEYPLSDYDEYTIPMYLKNILVYDFNFSEYRANEYIEDFYNKCIKFNK